MDVNKIPSAGSYLGSNVNSYKAEKNTNNSGIGEGGKAPVETVAAVYEPSAPEKTEAPVKTYSPDTETIARLKSEVEMRTENLRSLVEKLLLQQGQKVTDLSEMYQLLREGKVQADPETIAKAQEEISEDGYWGVKQTSERIFNFAIALSGGDPSKAQMLRDAVIQGYEEAKKIWGGELPEISQRTYEETLKKFDEWMGIKPDIDGEK